MSTHAAPEAGLRLSRKIIYILPTFQGVVFGFGALTVMLIAMVERNLISLLLAALMLSVFLLGLILCYRNVSGLLLQAGPSGALPCFAGDVAQFLLQVCAAGPRRAHKDLWLGFGADSLQAVSIAPGTQYTLRVSTPTFDRGVFPAPRLLLRTVYPAGLWRAWSRPDMNMSCLVYPRPLPCKLTVQAFSVAAQTAHSAPVPHSLQRGGVDDFVGLREYRAGDSLRHVAWQSLARGQGLKTRQFVQEPEQAIVLDWQMFAADHNSSDTEKILSFLCYQIIELSRQNKRIGLSMPGLFVEPGQGNAHMHELLEVLARWP
ncbi:MAG: DUF58 domain-containing protein [Gammaproteobacteria bacterium]|nr:DUF58 domain-containing protein [Gammaproteobacteria bacterium]